MSALLWSFDQLARFTRYEDFEVRYWAAERLASLFPKEAPDVIAGLILDDHEGTPELVAEHLGRHGGPRHIPVLLRGFRHGSDLTAAHCIEALARLGYEGTPETAATALHRREMSEPCLGLMVSALAEMSATHGHPGAGDIAGDFLLRRPELFAEPGALRGAIRLFTADFSDLIAKWITGLHFKGPDQVESCVRILLEELQLEDCGWCLRTDRTGRIDLDRTLKAIESGYDIDLRNRIEAGVRLEITQRLQCGEFSEIARSLASYIRSRADGFLELPGDTLPRSLDALARAFQTPSVIEMAEQLQPALHQWLIGILVAAAVKVTHYRNYLLELEAAAEDPDRLLALAGVESSSLLPLLPGRLAGMARGESKVEKRISDWCVRTLESRGPFFPKAIALETLGALEAVRFVPEICAHLADDNPYIYGAAERSLSRMGPELIEHTRGLLSTGHIQPDALQSLMRLSCEQGRVESLRLLVDFFDDTFETLGPEVGAELAGNVAHTDLLPHLRRWLKRSPAMVGHTLLLIGALHNLRIPEEESILQAIDDFWKGREEGAEDGGPSGQYVM